MYLAPHGQQHCVHSIPTPQVFLTCSLGNLCAIRLAIGLWLLNLRGCVSQQHFAQLNLDDFDQALYERGMAAYEFDEYKHLFDVRTKLQAFLRQWRFSLRFDADHVMRNATMRRWWAEHGR